MSDDGLEIDGEKLALIRENGSRIRAAITGESGKDYPLLPESPAEGDNRK